MNRINANDPVIVANMPRESRYASVIGRVVVVKVDLVVIATESVQSRVTGEWVELDWLVSAPLSIVKIAA